MCLVFQLKSEIKKEIKTTQNKYIHFCLNLHNMGHISLKKFEALNWLPVRDKCSHHIETSQLIYRASKSNDWFLHDGNIGR